MGSDLLLVSTPCTCSPHALGEYTADTEPASAACFSRALPVWCVLYGGWGAEWVGGTGRHRRGKQEESQKSKKGIGLLPSWVSTLNFFP